MLKICPCCKYVSNLYQTITFTCLLRINTCLANIRICPHFSRQRKCNANLELQIYHIIAPFANISKSVFSSSERIFWLPSFWNICVMTLIVLNKSGSGRKKTLSILGGKKNRNIQSENRKNRIIEERKNRYWNRGVVKRNSRVEIIVELEVNNGLQLQLYYSNLRFWVFTWRISES